MTNIFKDAYFGKLYKTRDERRAVFVSFNQYRENTAYLLLEGNKSADLLNCDGYYWADHKETKDDIVSEWKEPTNY